MQSRRTALTAAAFALPGGVVLAQAPAPAPTPTPAAAPFPYRPHAIRTPDGLTLAA